MASCTSLYEILGISVELWRWIQALTAMGHHDDEDDQGDGVPEQAEEKEEHDNNHVLCAEECNIGSNSL
ncbi:hypothetical protein SLEP1_g33815 [Rubroshorea leprosula]|uniref:Uncharacterized protein n=1 Tax=Rubroshorea leprosula TaxID=152421 RepID=A0AAV5KI09_9ROSI|nr:hypothetical protein SLEP1_g33815 [Rubroshorea leprosula]